MRALLFAGPVIAALASLMVACEGEEASPTPSPSPPQGRDASAGLPSMEFETIDLGQYSGIVGQRPQVFTVDTQAEWEDFWSRHQADVMPTPPLPPVDFSRNMVVAVVDQEEPSGGYRLEITGIDEIEGGLHVLASKAVPGPGCLVTAAMTQPFHIVRTAKLDLEPRLQISEETYSCG